MKYKKQDGSHISNYNNGHMKFKCTKHNKQKPDCQTKQKQDLTICCLQETHLTFKNTNK